MIQLHCTQKLLAKLPLDAGGRLQSKAQQAGGRLQSKAQQAEAANDAGESPLSGWHANLITLQRRNWVLFATMLPAFQCWSLA